MKIAGNQSYFFPYLGYFSLIHLADQFIIFDIAQYEKCSWINRNRILKPDGEVTYIRVPLRKASLHTSIQSMKISEEHDWKKKMLGQFQCYRKIAPYYNETMNFLEDCFQYNTNNLSELNIHLLRKTCDYLQIKHNITNIAEMNLSIEMPQEPDEWGLNITKALNGTVMYNLPGGLKFYNREKYKEQNIDLQFIKNNLHEYDQKREKFEMGLSILDVMMFNSLEEIHKMLDDYEVI